MQSRIFERAGMQFVRAKVENRKSAVQTKRRIETGLTKTGMKASEQKKIKEGLKPCSTEIVLT